LIILLDNLETVYLVYITCEFYVLDYVNFVSYILLPNLPCADNCVLLVLLIFGILSSFMIGSVVFN
jgi:hypothetical protein